MAEPENLKEWVRAENEKAKVELENSGNQILESVRK